ncbi:hypothetical protein [Vibrio vulnificus]|uniref:hypothetical protein n=1 Tax=Vibrio vulnificus TaxID=672 RepID=UPI0032429817
MSFYYPDGVVRSTPDEIIEENNFQHVTEGESRNLVPVEIMTPEEFAAGDYGVQIWLDNGREFAHTYQPRNIVAQHTVSHLVNKDGRIHPRKDYSGTFKWVIVPSAVQLPWRSIRIIRHSDGSIEWKFYMWNNAGSGQPPAGSEMVGCFFQIFGVVER